MVQFIKNLASLPKHCTQKKQSVSSNSDSALEETSCHHDPVYCQSESVPIPKTSDDSSLVRAGSSPKPKVIATAVAKAKQPSVKEILV